MSERHETMNFEFLPDEIFLDLFDYFDGPDLLEIFYGLNSRFNYLLYKQYRTYRLNFISISKHKFDTICQQHLPFIVDRVITLSLSDDDDTPQQIDVLLSYISSFEKLTHLQALFLSKIHTYERLIKILEQCHHLCYLTHLKCNSFSMEVNQEEFQSIVDHILSLPNLTHCDFNWPDGLQKHIRITTKISSSLERLSLSGNRLLFHHVNYLFKYTPRLKYFSAELTDYTDGSDQHPSIYINDFIDNYIPILLPTLTNINLSIIPRSDISKILSIFQNTPNLRRLNIDLIRNMIDGYQWEEILMKYLPKLKIFQLKMLYYLSLDKNIERQLKKLIHPFRRSFWIDQHQWFIRCFAYKTTAYISTPPHTLPDYGKKFPELFMSTFPNDTLQNFCNDVTDISMKTFFDDPIPSNIRLINIQQLDLLFPIHDQFLSIVPHLNRLQSLTVYVNKDTSQVQLQSLLDQAPHLYKLSVYDKNCLYFLRTKPLKFWHMELLKCRNISIRYLDLKELGVYSNEEQCIALAQSSLVVQCQVLSIQVDNRETIVHLVNNMINLRALNICSKYDIFSNHSSSISSDMISKNAKIHLNETIQWLKERLPSTYSIGRTECDDEIRIWIS